MEKRASIGAPKAINLMDIHFSYGFPREEHDVEKMIDTFDGVFWIVKGEKSLAMAKQILVAKIETSH